ncbi:MAG: hypothetical protein KC447_05800 [Rhodobacteraceae bacterium]|nr:hypothetical protein [Paracoccaceae bacterium]
MGWVKRIPSLPHHTNAITTDAMALAEQHFPDHFGDLLPLHYADTREHAFGAFDSFIEPRLQTFGDYQDAMAQVTPWTYRGYISLNINYGLLGPLEYIQRAERADFDGYEPFSSVEGSSAKS